MHIKQDLDVVLLAHVEDPGDLVLGAISAANVGAVRFEGPVADGDSDDLDFSGLHLDEGVLSDPGVPMLAEHGVALLRSKSIAEGVLVHADTFGVGLAEESVEERRGDPWLKHLPATNVGADHGFTVLGFGERDRSAKSCNEGLHLIDSRFEKK